MNKKIAKNAGWIIGAQIVKAAFGLVISFLTARYLGPSNYGLINYAAAIAAFVTPIAYLGLNCVLVQYVINEPDYEGETLGTAMLLSISSSILCIIGVFGFVSIANSGEKETLIVCVLYSFLLIFQSCELIRYWFQAKMLAKYSSLVSLGAYTVISIYKVYLLITGKSVYWFAVSNAIDYFLIAFVLTIIYTKMGGGRFSFSWVRAKEMLGKSKYYILSNLMIVIFAQTDKIMLKIMINDTATGYYSTAVACAGLTSFVFTAIIDSFRPVIFESKNSDRKEFESNMCKLYGIVIYLALMQSLVISVFAGVMIKLLYGSQYIPSIPALRLVVWYTTFSYMGAVRDIWILAEGKQKYLWKINLLGALSNVLLNSILIPAWGIMGAATASLITQFFTNVIVGFILPPIRYNNTLMIKGLNPRPIIRFTKEYITRLKARKTS